MRGRGQARPQPLPATRRVSAEGSWQRPRRQGSAQVGCSAAAATPRACPPWSPAARGSLGEKSPAPRCRSSAPPAPLFVFASVCPSAWPLAPSRRPVQAARPPRGRLAASLGAVLRAESRRARWGLRGQLPAAADLLGSGSARLRPQSWGGQDPHPFGPVLRQMGQDRTFRWLPGGGGRLPNARFPPALWGTFR